MHICLKNITSHGLIITYLKRMWKKQLRMKRIKKFFDLLVIYFSFFCKRNLMIDSSYFWFTSLKWISNQIRTSYNELYLFNRGNFQKGERDQDKRLDGYDISVSWTGTKLGPNMYFVNKQLTDISKIFKPSWFLTWFWTG